jgi:hypothetical protein
MAMYFFSSDRRRYGGILIFFVYFFCFIFHGMADEITGNTFAPLAEGESLSYKFTGHSAETNYIIFYRNKDGDNEEIARFHTNTMRNAARKIGSRIYFNIKDFPDDYSNIDSILYVLDGNTGMIENLNISIMFCYGITDNEEYIYYDTRNDRKTYAGIAVRNRETSKDFIFDFSNDLMKERGRFEIKYENEQKRLSIEFVIDGFLIDDEDKFAEGYIDLQDMTFHLTWAEDEEYMRLYSPLDMAGYTTSHITLDNLRLRDSPDTSAAVVTTLLQGADVQILETGAAATIDGITAPWVKVLSSSGYTGWCFSGYLEPIAKPVAKVEESVAETPPSVEPAAEAPSTPNPIPRTPPPEIKSTAGLPPPFIIAGASALVTGIVIVIIVLKKRKKS